MLELNEEICAVKWTIQDIVNLIVEKEGVIPSDEMVCAVVKRLKGNSTISSLADFCIDRGLLFIEAAIDARD